MIKRVDSINDMRLCDNMLNKLILDEFKYDDSLNENSKVSNYYEKACNDNNILLGYYLNESLVAYIYIKCNNETCFIDALYVENEYRNKGIAKELINEVFNICKTNSIKYIDINVMYKNDLAKHLYRSLGFNEFRLTMRKELKK